MRLTLELEQEHDGRWIAEVNELPGVMTYGSTPQEATARAKALALRVVALIVSNTARQAPSC